MLNEVTVIRRPEAVCIYCNDCHESTWTKTEMTTSYKQINSLIHTQPTTNQDFKKCCHPVAISFLSLCCYFCECQDVRHVCLQLTRQDALSLMSKDDRAMDADHTVVSINTAQWLAGEDSTVMKGRANLFLYVSVSYITVQYRKYLYIHVQTNELRPVFPLTILHDTCAITKSNPLRQICAKF